MTDDGQARRAQPSTLSFNDKWLTARKSNPKQDDQKAKKIRGCPCYITFSVIMFPRRNQMINTKAKRHYKQSRDNNVGFKISFD